MELLCGLLSGLFFIPNSPWASIFIIKSYRDAVKLQTKTTNETKPTNHIEHLIEMALNDHSKMPKDRPDYSFIDFSFDGRKYRQPRNIIKIILICHFENRYFVRGANELAVNVVCKWN